MTNARMLLIYKRNYSFNGNPLCNIGVDALRKCNGLK